MVRTVREALSSSKAARRRSRGDGLLNGLRVLSVIVAGIVAMVTLLPSRTESRVSFLVEGRAIGDELNGVLVFAIVGVMLVVLIVAAWKSRLAWRFKMSWPLFLAGAVYLVGFAILVSATLRRNFLALFSTSPAWLDHLSTFLDAEHAVAYAAFTIIVVMAWREKVGVLWLALALLAYGYALELGQELVPGRDYGLGDVAANGLGIAIGLIGIFLFDLLADMRKGRTGHVITSDRQRSARGSSRRVSRRSSQSSKVGLATLLVGVAISIVSILLGAMAEFRFGQVVSQIFTQLSAPYAVTFWIGVLVTALGWYTLHARRGRRGARVRSTRSG
jgi:VanZ family protein